jgi:hypothetical protein
MKKGEHLFIGVIAFLVYTYFISLLVRIPTDGSIFGLFSTLFGSVIPDFLEPATNWMHRGLGHSKRALKFVTIIFAITTICGLISFSISTSSIFYLISCFLLGYLVHLLADATTEVGLPD